MALIHKFIQGDQRLVIDVNSGAIHSIDDVVYDILKDEDHIPDANEARKELADKYDQNVIEEALADIKELIETQLLYSEDNYKEEAFELEPTFNVKAICLNIIHDCNLRCRYCFADQGEYKGKREAMSAEVGKAAVDFLIKNSGTVKNLDIDFFGGEPLMAFDTIKEVVAYARGLEKRFGKNIRFTITTNAMLLNDERAEYLNQNMHNIVLSIDGRKETNDQVRLTKRGTGSYDIILPNIKRMVEKREKGKLYYIRGTFTHENTDFYEDVMALAKEGFKEISIEPVVLSEGEELAITREDIPGIYKAYDDLYYEMLERIGTEREFQFYHFNIDLEGGPCLYKRISGCGAGSAYVAITPKGDIYPCHQFVGKEEFKLGNLNEDTFDQGLSKEFAEAHLYNKPTCLNCWARFYCGGGCQANNYNFNKDIHVPYEIGCELFKKRTECAIALKTSSMLSQSALNSK